MRIWKLAVLSAPLILSACSEVATSPTQVPTALVEQLASPDGPASRYVNAGSQSPPANVPPEYQHYTSLTVQADAGINGQTAWGQAVVNFEGNNASADITLAARNAAGTLVATNSGTAQASYIFPGRYGITASTNMYLPAACGITVQATAIGSVWDSFFTTNQSVLTWGKKTLSDGKNISQPACPPPPPPPPVTTPPQGGGPSSPPDNGPGATPPPPSTVPPYYNPRPSHRVCIIHGEGTDWQWEECWSVEDNDTRIGGTITARSSSIGNAVKASAVRATRATP